MIQDRVRRVWKSGRAINPWLIHPPILFAMLLFDVWLKTETVTATSSVGLGHWWDIALLERAMGDLTCGDLGRFRWAAAALYFTVCAAGAFFDLRPVRLDPAPWRPVALGATLLACAAASVALLVTWTGSKPSEIVAAAARDLEDCEYLGSLELALDAELPGALQEFRQRLETPDPGVRALIAARLLILESRDIAARRALRSGFEEGLATLERESWRTGHYGWDAVDRLLQRLLRVRLRLDPEACRASPHWRRWSVNPESVEDVKNWWRESREKLTGEP